MLIEVFRAGSPAAIAAGITAADLADVAAFDCANNPVPNVIGHPATDSPANATVMRFETRGDSLFAEVPERHPSFKPIVDGIKGQTILNRSMGFFGKRHPSNPTPGKIAPKHLGFLGGAAPGIAGLPALASYFAAHPEGVFSFAADGVTIEAGGDPMAAVVFDAAPEAPTEVLTITEPAPTPAPAPTVPPAATAPQQEETTMTAEEIKAAQEQIKADREKLDADQKTFAATAEANRKAANVATVRGLVTAAKVLPADEADLVAAFNAVDGGEVIAFAADATKTASPVSIIAGIMAKAGNVVPVGGDPLAPTFAAPDATSTATKQADLDKVRAERNAKFGS
jgi:hypothetical protein